MRSLFDPRLLLVLIFSATSSQARELTDVTGARVRLAERPVRIVTLAPSLGELAADLSGDEISRIVGVTDYTDYPPVLTKVKSVGGYSRFNLEAVLGLKPDLVLATRDGNAGDQINHLRELGVPVVVVDTESFASVGASIRLVAEAMGSRVEGERMATQLLVGIERIRVRTGRVASGTVLLQVGADPLVVAGKKSFLHEALETVGARNAYGDLEARYPRPSVEDAVTRNPDRILVMVLGGDPAPFIAAAASWKRFAGMKAVKSGRVGILKADTLLRPTLRLLEGLTLLERAVHAAK